MNQEQKNFREKIYLKLNILLDKTIFFIIAIAKKIVYNNTFVG